MDSTFDRLKAKVTANKSLFFFAGHKDQELITLAEKALGLEFPLSYRQFVAEWGMMSFGGLEYYGVIDGEFQDSGIPDVVWFNLTIRSEENFPQELIAFSDRDGVQYYCIDTSKKLDRDECPVVIWDNIHKKASQVLPIDFAQFAIEEIEGVIAE